MNRLKWATVLAGVLLASLFSSPMWADSVTLSAVPSASTVSQNGIFAVDINITGLSNAQGLYAFGFDLTFNPAVFSALSIVEGPLLPTGGSTFFIPGTIDNVGGIVSATGDTLFGDTNVTTDGTLAILTMQATGTGPGTIDFANVILVSSFDVNFNPLQITDFVTQSGTVTVTSSTVSEPSSRLLLLAGLFALGLLALKKQVI